MHTARPGHRHRSYPGNIRPGRAVTQGLAVYHGPFAAIALTNLTRTTPGAQTYNAATVGGTIPVGQADADLLQTGDQSWWECH